MLPPSKRAAHIVPPQSHKKRAYENVVSYHQSQGIGVENVQDSFEEKYAPVFSSQVEGDDERNSRRKRRKKSEKEEITDIFEAVKDVIKV